MTSFQPILVHTNQNFYDNNIVFLSEEKQTYNFVKNKKKLKEILSTPPITLNYIKKNSDRFILIDFSQNKKTAEYNYFEEDKLIFQILCKNGLEDLYIKTGLYAGVLTINGYTFEISPSCNRKMFLRMLKYANNIFADTTESFSNIDNLISEFPLFEYLFLNSLKRASIMGFPQEYIKQEYHDFRLHGNIDINNYIKKDIPFTGKFSSKNNERKYVQCIIDVLAYTLSQCKSETKNLFPNLNFVASELKSYASGKRPTFQSLHNAKKHKSLQNPMFNQFQQTLDYAEILFRKQNLLSNDKISNTTISGYLLDISSLWENYLVSLLRNSFGKEGWLISAQEEITLYPEVFFKRENRPDIVMRNSDGRIVVLDAKFKQMTFKPYDVDRNDLFQIQSYAGYYRERKENIVVCGLIYPFAERIPNDINSIHTNLYGLQESQTKFIVDGIYSSENDDKLIVIDEESNFINRLRLVID